MSATQLTGEAYPLVIDQGDITAPDFPRDLGWWRRFMPQWITVTMREDQAVELDYNGMHPLDTEPPTLSAAELRRGRESILRCSTMQVLARHIQS
jgi:hypothetical protein